jgi:hypothetical protein
VGTVAVALALIALAGAAYGFARRHPVNAGNVNDVPAPQEPAAATAAA